MFLKNRHRDQALLRHLYHIYIYFLNFTISMVSGRSSCILGAATPSNIDVWLCRAEILFMQRVISNTIDGLPVMVRTNLGSPC